MWIYIAKHNKVIINYISGTLDALKQKTDLKKIENSYE